MNLLEMHSSSSQGLKSLQPSAEPMAGLFTAPAQAYLEIVLRMEMSSR